MKLLIIFFTVYFFFSWILAWTYFNVHLQSVEEWAAWHDELVTGEYQYNSSQFRVLSFWIVEVINKAFIGQTVVSYITLRFLFTFLIFCIFHLFLLRWFSQERAFLCVVFLAAITPLTYMIYLQESDVLLQFFFLVGLWLVREKKFFVLTAVMVAGTFAKETIIFLVPFYFLLHAGRGRILRTVLESAVLAAVWAAAFYATRFVIYEGYNSALWQLPRNIAYLKTYFMYDPLVNPHLLYIPLFGIFWILPFVRLREKSFFFRRAAPFIIMYTVAHFLFAWPEETRVLLPLAFLVIPSGLMTIFGRSNMNLSKEY